MALHHQIAAKQTEGDLFMRTPEGHHYHLELLKKGLPTLSLYGVREPSPLTCCGLEPTEQLPLT